MKLEAQTPLHAPSTVVVETRGDTAILIDPDGPNWVATDGRGARLLQRLNGGTTLREVARDYGAREGLDPARGYGGARCLAPRFSRYRADRTRAVPRP
jgi:hypothetical protein